MLERRPRKHTPMRAVMPMVLLALFALGVAPSPAPKTAAYRTSYIQTLPALGTARYEGSLTLTFESDGVLSGWYRDDSTIYHHPVAGGYEGRTLWFSIGMRGYNRFSGKLLPSGEISGTMSKWRGHLLGTFVAKPVK